MSDTAVFELQSYLRNISRFDSDIFGVVPDGIFGKETTLSVKSFQKKFELAQTGIVNFETWQAIKKENAQAVFFFSEPIQTVKIRNSDLPLKLGDNNIIIYTLHLMLNKVALNFSNFKALDLNSAFTQNTQREIKRWQRVISHEETGEVDKTTWDSLAMFYLLEIE